LTCFILLEAPLKDKGWDYYIVSLLYMYVRIQGLG
jgi:hypothetical protein